MKHFLLLIILFLGLNSFSQVPANDLIANAIEVTSSNFVDEHLRLDLATIPTSSSIGGCDMFTLGVKVVYYKFTANTNAVVNASIRNQDNSMPTANTSGLTFYTASNLNVTSNNQLTIASACVLGTDTSFTLTVGQSYYLLVDYSEIGIESKITIDLPQSVPTLERDALIALYNATNGPNWVNNTNWNTTEPVSTWYGITTENGHVIRVNLHNNNLTGNIPLEIGNLTSLNGLYLNNNQLSGTIPNLSSLPLQILSFQDNHFEFGDFENEFNNYQSLGGNFTYTPQNVFYQNYTIAKNIVENHTFISTVSGNNNTYQWYKVNTAYFSSNINDVTLLTGETNYTLTISNIQTSNLAYYYCIVSNTVVTGLEIKKEYFNLVQAVPNIEKSALIALYNATDGPNWFNNNNWNSNEPISTWQGVTVENGHVTVINIYNNNLTGTLPIELQNLSFLEILSISYNNLSGTIPNLTGLSNLHTLYIGENYFQFGDFENELSSYQATLTNFWYDRMKKIETEISENIVIGNNYMYTMPTVSGVGVTYQWYKNGLPISGETNLTLNITNAQITDSADYTCKASSTIVTDLTIERKIIHLYGIVLPVDKNALVALYNATNGANWTDNTNWLTAAPVHEWKGIQMQGNRVTNISLSNNNLVGVLPSQIGGLDALKYFYVDSNQLSGTLPTQIGNLTSLTYLNMGWNDLTGSLPIQIGNLTSLINLNMGWNDLTGSLPTQIGNLTSLTNLNMGWNDLTGNLPTQIGNLTNLTELHLFRNNFTGNLPTELGNCVNLVKLSIYDNQFQGSLPIELAALTKLRHFYLAGNQFSGDFPNIFINMTDLGAVMIDGSFSINSPNSFTGDIDLSNNPMLFAFICDNNSISSVDLRNGNNSNCFSHNMIFQGNSNLTCVFVDDAAWSTTNWTNIDATATFVETQGECDVLATDENLLNESLITIYPNPIKDILNITLNNNSQIKNVKIYDVIGKQLINSTENKINIQNFKSGTYLIVITDNNNVITRKKIIKK